MSSTPVTASQDDGGQRSEAPSTPRGAAPMAALPPALAGLVMDVVGKCRLWKSERVDVARELCAHFRDGLEAGATPEELAGAFGDPRQAARLITATRRRLRPRWWRVSMLMLRGTGATLAVCIAMYAVLLARFYLASPTISLNVVKELNGPILKTAPDDRAWPLYIRAKIEFGPYEDFTGKVSGVEPTRPGDENWEAYAEWLKKHAPALETVRAAAAKPVLGYLYRAGTDPEYAKALEATNPGYTYDPSAEEQTDNPIGYSILLPQLGEMRRFARALRADAYLAASEGDRARFLADVEALLGIGEQALGERFIIGQTVGFAIADLALDVILEHVDRPDFLGATDLRDVAHKLAGFGGGGHISLDLSLEALLIEDILQRYFSDDGHGDGRYIGAVEQTESLYRDWGLVKPKGYRLMRAVQPVQSVIMPSRAEIREMARRAVAAAAVDDALPPWRHDERSSDALHQEVLEASVYKVVPFLRSLTFVGDEGPIASSCGWRDRFLAKRDATLAVIGMESYRRDRGRWPSSLDELVPAFLPAVPLDPCDGKALRYAAPRSESERPVLYSIGVDGVDDGGKVPETEAGRFGVHHLYWLGKFRSTAARTPEEQASLDAVRGDWVLWPVPAALKSEAK